MKLLILKNYLSISLILYTVLPFSLKSFGQYDFCMPTGEACYNKTTIYTPNGTPVQVWILATDDYTSQEKQDILDSLLEDEDYGDKITFMDKATLSYNCHGYVWYISEGGTTVFYEPLNEYIFMNDGCYDQVMLESSAPKVNYSAGHSAITTDELGIVISKWDFGPLFKHAIEDCPYYEGSQITYYGFKFNEIINQEHSTGETKTKLGCEISAQNITIKNHSKVILDAEIHIEINGPLEFETGSILKMK